MLSTSDPCLVNLDSRKYNILHKFVHFLLQFFFSVIPSIHRCCGHRGIKAVRLTYTPLVSTFMQDRTRNLKSLAGAQLGRLASSNAANRAYDLASRARGAVEQASPARGSPSNSQSQSQGQGQGQSWSQWAWDKLPRRGPTIPGVETVHLFPGWATRRFQNRDG